MHEYCVCINLGSIMNIHMLPSLTYFIYALSANNKQRKFCDVLFWDTHICHAKFRRQQYSSVFVNETWLECTYHSSAVGMKELISYESATLPWSHGPSIQFLCFFFFLIKTKNIILLRSSTDLFLTAKMAASLGHATTMNPTDAFHCHLAKRPLS